MAIEQVLINKFDLNRDVSAQIEDEAHRWNWKVVGKIGYDKAFIRAQLMNCPTNAYTCGAVAQDLKALWRNVLYALG